MTLKPNETIMLDPKLCEYFIGNLQAHTIELVIQNSALIYICSWDSPEIADWMAKQEIVNASVTFAPNELLEATWKWIQESKQYRIDEACMLETNFLIYILKNGYSDIWNKVKGSRGPEIMAIALSKKDKWE